MSNKFWMISGNTGKELKAEFFVGYETIELAMKTFEESGGTTCLILRSDVAPYYGQALDELIVCAAYGTNTNGWRVFTLPPTSWDEIWAK